MQGVKDGCCRPAIHNCSCLPAIRERGKRQITYEPTRIRCTNWSKFNGITWPSILSMLVSEQKTIMNDPCSLSTPFHPNLNARRLHLHGCSHNCVPVLEGFEVQSYLWYNFIQLSVKLSSLWKRRWTGGVNVLAWEIVTLERIVMLYYEKIITFAVKIITWRMTQICWMFTTLMYLTKVTGLHVSSLPPSPCLILLWIFAGGC
jgi:hypothetical protein